jgi:hypothetical protein
VYFDQNSSQQGTTATASAGGTEGFDYIGSDGVTWFHQNTTGSLSASAGSDPARLLQVTASDKSPDPGLMSSPGQLSNGHLSGGVTATAGWTNDSVTVTNPSGSNLPDTIRLDFALTISNTWAMPFGTLKATYNGTTLSYAADGMYGSLGLRPDPSNSGKVDTSTVAAGTDRVDTFHIDLALDKAGHSDPFSLGLQLAPFMGLFSDSPANYKNATANLALTGITLPDGTPLSSLGDSVSFASDLTAPASVPEPQALAAWALIVASVAGFGSRRFRSVRS